MIRRSELHNGREPVTSPTISSAMAPPPSPPLEASQSIRPAEPVQPIRSDEVYTLSEFSRRAGLQRNGLRQAKRRGLQIRKCGRNRYVLGADWQEFLRQQPPADD